MAEILLQTKLFVPQLRPSTIPRPHLIQKLNHGLNGKLTLVSAPAGFGKSTLISNWLHQCQQPYSWLSLGVEENEPSQFFTYLVAALQKIDKTIGQAAVSLLGSAQSLPLTSLLIPLINDLAGLSQQAILILEDYHLIQNLDIHKALVFLLENLPPQLHLVIISREDPALPLHWLRVSGQMTGIYIQDLRLSSQEATQFLNQTMKLDLAEQDVAMLAQRTEGWVGGLQMAAISLQGMPDPHEFVISFAGDDRYIADYLLNEVFHRQLEQIQDFLLKTAVLNRFCPALCDAILEKPPNHSYKIITYLEETNLFIIPLDNKREWYRYHHLFSDFLRLHLHNQYSDKTNLLHQRAAAWYEDNGLLVEAIENALTGEDYERAIRLITQNRMEAIFGHAQWTTFLNWMKALPPELVRSQPQLNLHFAWALFSTGQWLATEPYLKEIEAAFSEGKLTADQSWMLGEVAAIRALVSYETGYLNRSKEMAAKAHELLPEANKMIRSVASLAEGMAQMWSDTDIQTKHRYLANAFDMAQEAGNMTVSLFALGCRTILEVRGGRLQQAARLYQQTRTLGTVANNILLGPVGVTCVQMGEVLREWNRLEEAESVLWEGIKLCQQQQGMPVWIIEGHVNLARLKLATGDEQQAEKLFQQAETLLAELPRQGVTVQHLLSATQSYRLRYWLAQGKIDIAAQWLAKNGISLDSAISPTNATNHLLLARIFLEQGHLDKTQRILQRVEAIVPSCESARLSAELFILRALCRHAQRDQEQAIELLARSLQISEPEGYIRLFVEYGEPMVRLLQTAVQQGITSAYTDKLLSAFDKLPAPLAPESSATLLEPLNDREQQVLKLMAAGLSNRQISDELYLSVNTIKAYTSRIYGKLGVNGRADAINQAHHLGLL